MGRSVSGGIGVLVIVGVLVVVGVFVETGVSVIGWGVLVGVAESAAILCMTDHVWAASVSAGTGRLGCWTDETPHAMRINNAKIASNIRRRCFLSIGPPDS